MLANIEISWNLFKLYSIPNVGVDNRSIRATFSKKRKTIYTLFLEAALFFNSASVLLNFIMNWASKIASCYLIHITIITLSYNLYLVYLCPCLGLSLFMSYLCDLFFIFSLRFIVINHITSFKQTYLFFVYFLEYFLLLLDDNVDEESE